MERKGGRNKETVRAQLAPAAGERGGGQKYPLKGYIPSWDIYSPGRRLGFQTSSTGSNYNVFDGSTNTPGSVAVDPWKE